MQSYEIDVPIDRHDQLAFFSLSQPRTHPMMRRSEPGLILEAECGTLINT